MYTVISLIDVFGTELLNSDGQHLTAVPDNKQNFSTLPWDHLSRDGLYMT